MAPSSFRASMSPGPLRSWLAHPGHGRQRSSGLFILPVRQTEAIHDLEPQALSDSRQLLSIYGRFLVVARFLFIDYGTGSIIWFRGS